MTVNLAIIGTTSSEYLQTIEGVLARALRDGVSALEDPRVACPRNARRLHDNIVEVLAGFTLGTLARSLHLGVVRWFGDALAHELLESFARACRLEHLDADVTYLDDAKRRPIVEAFASGMHLRYCAMSRALEGMLRELDALVQRMAPHKGRATNLMLGSLCNDADDLERSLAEEIRFAWSMFSAAASGQPVPSIEGRMIRSAAMWGTWVTRMSVPQYQSSATYQPTTPSRDEVQGAGYILLVA